MKDYLHLVINALYLQSFNHSTIQPFNIRSKLLTKFHQNKSELKKKICFIVNPISGFGKQKIIEKLIQENLNLSLFEYTIVYTAFAKHAIELSKKAVTEKFDIVVAVGGDGSINEIARGLINTETALAIVPAGSGNGLARHLNIPLKLIKSIELINKARVKHIDTVSLNEEFFFNVSGIGFDAFVGEKIAKLSNRGFFSYFKIIAAEFYKYKEQNFEITIDGKLFSKKAFLICFANGAQWGNNAFISPQADIQDGNIDIAVLKNVSIFNVTKIAVQVLNKTIHKSSNLEIIKAKEISVKQTSSIAHIDGEPVQTGSTLNLKVNPLSLKLIVP